MNKAKRDDNQHDAGGYQNANKCLAPRGGRRRSGALLLCIVELDERRVGLLGLGVLRLIGHSPHLPTLGEYEHTDDGETDHAGRNTSDGERIEARLLHRSLSGLLIRLLAILLVETVTVSTIQSMDQAPLTEG